MHCMRPSRSFGRKGSCPLLAPVLAVEARHASRSGVHPPHTSVSLCQAQRLRGAGAGDPGAPAAVRPGLYPRRQSVEAGLRRTAVVHGLRAEVRALPSSLLCSSRDENRFLPTGSSGEASLLLTLRLQRGEPVVPALAAQLAGSGHRR